MSALRSICMLVLFVSLVSIGCSRSDDKVQIPAYPGAIDNQEHNAKMMGVSLAKVKRVVTTDSFDTVFAFYEEKLAHYKPEIMSYDLEDGRQAAFSIEKGNITVAVQEFTEEGLVAISYMGFGF